MSHVASFKLNQKLHLIQNQKLLDFTEITQQLFFSSTNDISNLNKKKSTTNRNWNSTNFYWQLLCNLPQSSFERQHGSTHCLFNESEILFVFPKIFNSQLFFNCRPKSSKSMFSISIEGWTNQQQIRHWNPSKSEPDRYHLNWELTVLSLSLWHF